MNRIQKRRWLKLPWWTALCAAILFPFLCSAATDLHLPVLKTRTGTLTNVTVLNKTATDIYFSHSRGIGNVKISDIDDDDALHALGLKVEAKAKDQSSSTNSPAMNVLSTAKVALSSARERLQSFPAAAPVLAKLESLFSVPPPKKTLQIAGAALLVVYLFFCFCLKSICRKAGTDPGALIWIPAFQTIPAFRAARMSGWWFIPSLVPVLNLFAGLLWSFKIVQARGKSVLVSLALLLPAVNLLAFLYLAFSSAAESTVSQRPKVGRASAALAEA
jgi:hypothetical protein